MSWNYRVIYHPAKYVEGRVEKEDAYYAIHEVYYDEKGKPDSYAEPAIIIGDEIFNEKEDRVHSVNSLTWIIEKLKEAIEKDVLEIGKDFDDE